MSAGITHEQREITEHGGIVTRLGYLRCLDCWGDQNIVDARAEWVPLTQLAADQYSTCDGCERDISQTTPRTFTADVTIEHFTCKIF
jgi:hypothetical protein